MGIYNIAVIKGDGIGPEIVNETIKVLDKVAANYNHSFNYTDILLGGVAIDKTGTPLPEETVEIAKKSDCVLMGAIGDPKYDTLPGDQRPEKGLLKIREALGLYCNLRPAVIHNTLIDACPLKSEIVQGGLDIMIVRELTGGIYFGDRGYRQGRHGEEAYDTESYSPMEIKRIAKIAFDTAMVRNKKLTSVDKANVLESSRLWRKIVTEMSADYPQVTLEHMYVDNAAMQLVRNPKQFDVILTNNIFGDILSDEASMITGSIGMLPSASLSGADGVGLYEPIHGSAPDIAGQNKANPIATILSAAMMLRYALGLETEAKAVEAAVTKVLEAGYRTPDIISEGMTEVGTKEIGDLIAQMLV